MALIKQANAREITRDALVLDLGDLQRQASLIIQSAREQAEAILAEARAERARIIAGAAETGRAEGFAKGLEQGRKDGASKGREEAITEARPRLEELQSAWTGALREFVEHRRAMLLSAERDVLRLAVRIAQRVVKRVITTDHRVVAEQLGAVLAVVVRPTELVVRIHPDDSAIAGEALPELARQFPLATSVELVHDAGLARGSCIAQMRGGDGGPPGEIDASIDTQLARIVEALLPGSTATSAAEPT